MAQMIAVESSPPDRQTPTGTSLRNRFFGIWKRLRLDFRERPVGPLPPRAIEPDLERASRRDLLNPGVEGRRSLIQLAVEEEVGGHLPVRFSYIEARGQYGLHL